MLVLRRKVGEAILISGDIEIEIIEISRTRVKLGVTAPQSVRVDRREVISVAAENRTASDLLQSRGGGIQDLISLLPLSRFSDTRTQVLQETADK